MQFGLFRMHSYGQWYMVITFRILLPPPLRPSWDIGQAVRVVHETGEIFDFPEAGELATSIVGDTD